MKTDMQESRELSRKKENMANTMGKKVSTVMKQIAASKIKDVKNADLSYNKHVTQEVRNEEQV